MQVTSNSKRSQSGMQSCLDERSEAVAEMLKAMPAWSLRASQVNKELPGAAITSVCSASLAVFYQGVVS